MSRHEMFENGMKSVVGWDPPLQTFFIQHGPYHQEDGEWVGEGPRLWLGTSFGEIPDIMAFVGVCYDNGIPLDSSVSELLKRDVLLDI